MESDVIKFSVLTTVYNREQFLAEAIESVLGQSYPHFELILVDDCSVDASVEIAKKYEQLDSRVKVFVNDKNLGDYPNRNRAISLAQHEYIKFLDADDYLQPKALETYSEAVAESQEYDVLYWMNVWCDSTIPKSATWVLNARESYRRGYVENQRMFEAAPNSCLYRKSVFELHGLFKLDRLTGDYEMGHRLCLAGNVGILHTEKPLAFWRSHDNQESSSTAQKLHLTSNYIRIAQEYLVAAESFFSDDEIQRIRIKQMHVEAQLIRSALGRLQFMGLLRILSNLNFPIVQVAVKVWKGFPLTVDT